MPSSALLRFFILTGSLAAFLAGCLKSPSPEVELQELRAQAEERLLQDAKLAFVREDYPEAVLLFHRFVKNHPKSKLAPEAQWWLARSYQQSGNLRLALARFQRLARSSSTHPYRHEARLQANALIEALGIEAMPSTIKGFSVKFQQLPEGGAASFLIAHNRLRKGSVLLINLGCQLRRPSHSPSDGHERHEWENYLGQDLEAMVEDAFQAGYAVYLGVSLPCLGHVANRGGVEDVPQWHDWVFDPQSNRVRMSPDFSLFSLGYQSAMREMLFEVSRFKVAGIVFQEDRPLGPRGGLSPIAIKRFEAAFDIKLDPTTLFVRGKPVRLSQRRSEDIRKRFMPPYPDVFWKWAGWKSRERLRVMSDLVQTLRGQFPRLTFGLEIHPESLYAPVYALANFSEDWVETAHAPFDFFVARFPESLRPGGPGLSHGGAQSDSGVFARELVQRMVDYLKDPQRVWVIRPEQRLRPDAASVLTDHGAESEAWPDGVGEIIEIAPVP